MTTVNNSINNTLEAPVLGTPTSGTLTNCTGLPISTGVSGLGTGIATALGSAVNGSGAVSLTTSPSFVTPVLGTPTSGNLSNCTNLPIGNTFTTGLNGGNVTNSTPLMAGFGVTQTINGTHVRITFCGQVSGGVSGDSMIGIRYGTGTAPSQGASVTGTLIGTVIAVNNAAAAFTIGFSKSALITGLSSGTTYWFDMQLAQGSGSASISLQNVDCIVMSF